MKEGFHCGRRNEGAAEFPELRGEECLILSINWGWLGVLGAQLRRADSVQDDIDIDACLISD